MIPVVNTRADLEALRGTAVFGDVLRAIRGGATIWTNAGTAETPDWQAATDAAALSRWGFTEQEFQAEVARAGLAPPDPPAPPTPPPTPHPHDVELERSRRLALGFDFDFGDVRGKHHIGTTPDDMTGWDEVTKWATARASGAVGSETIDILTDTGPATVSPQEWFAVIAAATESRQPIWAASFALAAMDPIPADFRDDVYWS